MTGFKSLLANQLVQWRLLAFLITPVEKWSAVQQRTSPLVKPGKTPEQKWLLAPMQVGVKPFCVFYVNYLAEKIRKWISGAQEGG